MARLRGAVAGTAAGLPAVRSQGGQPRRPRSLLQQPTVTVASSPFISNIATPVILVARGS